MLRVLAGDDLRKLGDRDPGRVQAGRDHGGVRVRRNLVNEQAVALVTDIVVVRDRFAGLEDLVGDRRTVRRLSREVFGRIDPRLDSRRLWQ